MPLRKPEPVPDLRRGRKRFPVPIRTYAFTGCGSWSQWVMSDICQRRCQGSTAPRLISEVKGTTGNPVYVFLDSWSRAAKAARRG